MIFHSVYKLKQANVTGIFIITVKEHTGDVFNLYVTVVKRAPALLTKYKMKQADLHWF